MFLSGLTILKLKTLCERFECGIYHSNQPMLGDMSLELQSLVGKEKKNKENRK